MKKFAVLCLSVLIGISVLSETVLAGVTGDVDNDGRVTVADARLLLRFAVGLEFFDASTITKGDIDGNGNTDACDARNALRLSVGLPLITENENDENIIKNFADAVNADNLVAYMDKLTDIAEEKGRFIGQSGAEDTENWLLSMLKNFGYTEQEAFKEEFVYEDDYDQEQTENNVVAVLPTGKENAKVLILSAHFDCVSAGTGAVDNGSGVATLLEIARLLKENDKGNYPYEIRIMFFNGEEEGYYGARGYLKTLSAEQKARIAFVLNMDMTAHFKNTGKDNFLCVSTEPLNSSYAYREAVDNIGSIAITKAHSVLGAGDETAFYNPVTAGKHDIVPFRKEGIPALTLSWREVSEEENGCDYNLCPPEWIHTTYDRLYNLDTVSHLYTSRLVCGAVAYLLYE